MKNVTKLFWVWDFEQEEAWYNEMADKGLNLIRIRPLRYAFEEGTPGEYQYRQEYLSDSPTSEKGREYIRFIEDTGAELVCTYWQWAVFRRKKGEGAFNLFSDLDSRIAHLEKIFRFILLLAAANFLIGTSNLISGVANRMDVVGFGALINLAIGILGFRGSWKLYQRLEKLRRERDIHE